MADFLERLRTGPPIVADGGMGALLIGATPGLRCPEQANALEGRGVDLFMIETFFDLDQLVAAVEAVRGVSSLPIVALLTFDDEAEIAGGIDAAAAGRQLAGLDVAAIGTNHGAGPHAALLELDAMRDSGVPLAALPNIGLASIVGG